MMAWTSVIACVSALTFAASEVTFGVAPVHRNLAAGSSSRCQVTDGQHVREHFRDQLHPSGHPSTGRIHDRQGQPEIRNGLLVESCKFVGAEKEWVLWRGSC